MIQQQDPWGAPPQAPQTAHAHPRAMPNFTLTRRQVSTMIILSIVTFGIYYLFWYCSVQNQIRYKTGLGFGGFGHLMATIFSFGLYAIYWHFVITQRIGAAGGENKRSRYGILYLVIMVINFVVQIATSSADDGLRFGLMGAAMVAILVISFYIMAQIQTDINNIGQQNNPSSDFVN